MKNGRPVTRSICADCDTKRLRIGVLPDQCRRSICGAGHRWKPALAMTKIGIVLLACLVMILLACSPEAPAAEPTMDATAGASHQEPTSAPHAHSARHGSTSAPSCGVYRDDRISGANDDTRFRRSVAHTGVAVHINAFGAAWTC